MAELYFDLVVAGKRTCNNENGTVKKVPKHLQTEVLALLEERGYDADGRPKAEK